MDGFQRYLKNKGLLAFKGSLANNPIPFPSSFPVKKPSKAIQSRQRKKRQGLADQGTNLEAPQEFSEKAWHFICKLFRNHSLGSEQPKSMAQLEILGKELGWKC